MQGVVVRDGRDRLDDPGYDAVQLRYSVVDGGDDDEVWWEPTASVYEIIAPPPAPLVRWEAFTEDDGDTFYYDHVSGVNTWAKPDGFDEAAPPLPKAPPKPAATGAHTVLEAMSTPATTPSVLTCEGIRVCHFKPDAQAAFLHRVELAKDERGRLNADAGHVPDQRRAVVLSAPVQGILHYSVVPQGHELAPLNLRHYLLRGSTDRRPCNSGFFDLRCTSDASTTARRRPNGVSADSKPPVRCDLCNNLFCRRQAARVSAPFLLTPIVRVLWAWINRLFPSATLALLGWHMHVLVPCARSLVWDCRVSPPMRHVSPPMRPGPRTAAATPLTPCA
jgi:hypothetical protein